MKYFLREELAMMIPCLTDKERYFLARKYPVLPEIKDRLIVPDTSAGIMWSGSILPALYTAPDKLIKELYADINYMKRKRPMYIVKGRNSRKWHDPSLEGQEN